MELADYVDNIKLELTGGVLEIELDDATLGKIVGRSLREVQRFIDETQIITVPFSPCIDLSNLTGTDSNPVNISSVSRIFRAVGYLGDTTSSTATLYTDPAWASQWQMLCGGGDMYNLQDWVSNYASWNTLLQLRNTTSTDLAFKQDMHDKKLYINATFDKPTLITIEYVPKFTDVSQVKSDYWIDIIERMSVALTKVTLGRIRTRYKQSNALWSQDGDTLLQEGTQELSDLREKLRVNSQIIYPMD